MCGIYACIHVCMRLRESLYRISTVCKTDSLYVFFVGGGGGGGGGCWLARLVLVIQNK